MRKTLFVLLVGILTFGASAQAEDTPQAELQQAELQQAEQQDQAPAEPSGNAPQVTSESCSELPANALGGNLVFSADEVPAAGQTCGGAVCGRGEYCCNPSCSRCVPFGWSCTQESCN